MKTCSGKATCATGLRQIAHSHLALLPRSSGRLSAAGKPQAHGPQLHHRRPVISAAGYNSGQAAVVTVQDLPPEIQTLRGYEAQMLGLLENFTALPVERLHSILRYTVSHATPRFTATVQELEVYLRILESSGVVKESEKGWYIVSSEASHDAAPAKAAPAASNGAPSTPAPYRSPSPVPIPRDKRAPSPLPNYNEYPEYLQPMAAYEQQMLGLLVCFEGMSAKRLRQALQITMIEPKFKVTDDEYWGWLDWLVSTNRITVDDKGLYRASEDAVNLHESSPTPAPKRTPDRAVAATIAAYTTLPAPSMPANGVARAARQPVLHAPAAARSPSPRPSAFAELRLGSSSASPELQMQQAFEDAARIKSPSVDTSVINGLQQAIHDAKRMQPAAAAVVAAAVVEHGHNGNGVKGLHEEENEEPGEAKEDAASYEPPTYGDLWGVAT